MKCIPWNAVVQALRDENVEYVFGFPGDPRHLISDLVSHSNIKFVLMRHEASGVSAAYAYARVTGKVGICFAAAAPHLGMKTPGRDRTVHQAGYHIFRVVLFYKDTCGR